jgi:serine phosphatase RsbU (regulator of sigma subunit)/ligand-binding sensor domain-containing protein
VRYSLIAGFFIHYLILIWFFCGCAQQGVFARANELGNPIVRNFTPDEYHAHSQNWCAVQDRQGLILIGNQMGILEYDGSYWHLIPEFNRRVLSLALDAADDRVYVASSGELGYLAFNQKGSRVFVSLKDKLPQTEQQFVDIWNCCVNSTGVFFILNDRIFFWNKKEMKVLQKEPINFRSAIVFQERIILGTYNHGLYETDGTDMWELNCQTVTDWQEYGMCIPIVYDADTVMVVTVKKGLFLCRLSERSIADFTPFFCEITPFLIKNIVVKGIQLTNDRLALGLYLCGVVIINKQGKLLQIIDKKNGLPENYISGMLLDQQGNLWVTQNYGLSYIETESPLTKFDQTRGLEGIILSIIRHQNQIYVGNFNGIFKLIPTALTQQVNNPVFVQINKTFSNCFDFLSWGEVLFALSSNGVLQIIDDSVREMALPSSPYCLAKSEKFPRCIFLGLSKGIIAIELNQPDIQGSFYDLKIIERFPAILCAVRKIVADNHGDLWMSTEYDGVIQIHFNSADVFDYSIRFYTQKDGLPELAWNKIHYLDQRILLATAKGILELKKREGVQPAGNPCEFVPETTFGLSLNTVNLSFSSIQKSRENTYYVFTPQGVALTEKKRDGQWHADFLRLRKTTGVFENMLLEDDGILWLCGVESRSLFRFDTTIKKEYQPAYSVKIRFVQSGKENILFSGSYFREEKKPQDHYSSISDQQPDLLQVVLPYRENSLMFQYSACFYEHSQANRFSIKLSGFEKEWSNWLDKREKEYSNLPEGEYCFFVKAKNIFDHISNTAEFRFSIRPPWFRSYWSYGAYIFCFILLVFGLIRLNTRRLLAAQKKLEKIISERTAEVIAQKKQIEQKNDYLQEAYQKLNISNQQLTEAKDALWGEMALAKKIQTVLLPKAPHIPGYDIAAYMNPASEVGGDYYDVICIDNNDGRNGSCARPQSLDEKGSSEIGAYNYMPLQVLSPTPSYWLIIGDVSGHGVSAGLVMMMVQTAIHLALKMNSRFSPAEILTVVNTIIYENIQKLGEDKYMTMTILNCAADGNFYFSGLHQDILLYRQATRQVEIAQTNGIWIGLTEDIGQSLNVEQICLQPNDTMLLFTDGIPEAVDQAGKMYSQEKLQQIFEKLGHLSADQIKNGILDSLHSYDCQDDITLMVIKRNE